MNVAQAYALYAGGPGSGCNPEAGKCGRPSTGMSDRAKRALATYVPVSSEKVQLAKRIERTVAKLTGGVPTANNSPFDVVIKGKIGVEIKSIQEAGNDKLTMHPASLRRKLQAARSMRLKKTLTIAVDLRAGKETWYYRQGLGSFRLGAMQQVNLSALKRLAT